MARGNRSHYGKSPANLEAICRAPRLEVGRVLLKVRVAKMAVTNPTAVAFCNNRVRPVADKLAQAYYLAKEVRNEWYANNMGDILPVGGGTVADGADVDGRHPITADAAILIINRLEDLIADYEASNNAKLFTVLAVAVNPNP